MADTGFQNINIPGIIERYVLNTCSREELEQILALANENPEALREALQQQWERAKDAPGLDAGRADWLFDSLMERAKEVEAFSGAPLAENEGAAVYSIQRNSTKRLKWLAIAASVVVVVSSALFIVSKNGQRNTGNVAVAELIPDKAPGGDRALLTLADGTEIILDTAANGALAEQGGMAVVKMNGQLLYTNAPGADEMLYNTITTPRGGQYQLELQDGTKVWLNAASSLRFPTVFKGSDRKVELTGEGYFEVAHNSKKPFKVLVNGSEINVLGTHFNINGYTDEPAMKVTLLEGKVMVSRQQQYVLLSPGQQAAVTGQSTDIAVANGVNVEDVVAWKNGLITFSGADVGEVMRQIARWYDVEVGYEGNVETAHLSGSVPRNLNLALVIRVLEESGIAVKHSGKKFIATPKP